MQAHSQHGAADMQFAGHLEKMALRSKSGILNGISNIRQEERKTSVSGLRQLQCRSFSFN